MVLAFGLCQAGLGVGIVLFHPEWRDPRYGKVEADLRLRRPANSLLVVMLGSSRTHSGFEAGIVEKSLAGQIKRPVTVANFAVSGGGPFSELLTFRRLMHDGHRPDLVMLDLTPPFLKDATLREELSPDRLPSGRLRPFELSLVAKYRGTWIASEWARWLMAWSAPTVTFRTEILSSVWPSTVPERLKEPESDEFGWLRLTPDQNSSLQLSRENTTREMYAHDLRDFRIDGPNLLAIKQLLTELRDAEIPVLLVVTSESQEFQSFYGTGHERKVRELCDALKRDFPVRIIDARQWFSRSDFLDLHHLHADSARRFSLRLAREAILPQLSGESVSPATIAREKLPAVY